MQEDQVASAELEDDDEELPPVDPRRTSIIIISDFVCPWCYIGTTEIERLGEKYDLDVRFAPYLLDPTTPPEGKPRKPYSQPGDGPSPIEQRGESLGLTYTRGREWTSNSLLAHEASEFVTEHESQEVAWAFHKAMFKAYFTDLVDIGKPETLVEIGASVGVPADAMRVALENGTYRGQVAEGIRWARAIGVTGVPTFVFDERTGVVGAQDLAVLEQVMQQLGKVPKEA